MPFLTDEADCLINLFFFCRVLRNGGKAVLLTSSKLKDHLLQCVQSIRDYTPHKPEVPHPEIKQPDSQQMDKNSLSHSANIHWEPEDPIYLKLGETHAYMCIFNKLCDYSRGDKEWRLPIHCSLLITCSCLSFQLHNKWHLNLSKNSNVLGNVYVLLYLIIVN